MLGQMQITLSVSVLPLPTCSQELADFPGTTLLRIERMRWFVPPLAAAAYKVGRQMYNLAVDQEFVGLPEYPSDVEWTTYLDSRLPAGLSPEEIDLWRSFFLIGWYSCVFHLC